MLGSEEALCSEVEALYHLGQRSSAFDVIVLSTLEQRLVPALSFITEKSRRKKEPKLHMLLEAIVT